MLADGGASQGSDVLLSVVTALASVLSAIAAIWVVLVAGPRYRLYYGPVRPTQLSDGSWEVRLYLSGRGRRDITRKAFDDCTPVAVDIGVPIRRLAHVLSSESALWIVTHRVEGTRLLVGPGLIGRRQDLIFILNADAKPVNLTCQASLIDVQVRRQRLPPVERLLASVGLTLLGLVVVWGPVFVLLSRHWHWSVPNRLLVIAVSLVGWAAIFTWIMVRNRRAVQ